LPPAAECGFIVIFAIGGLTGVMVASVPTMLLFCASGSLQSGSIRLELAKQGQVRSAGR
jgi:hypothetical protein